MVPVEQFADWSAALKVFYVLCGIIGTLTVIGLITGLVLFIAAVMQDIPEWNQ